ncbi:MAG: gamma-glutamyltransferase, partial [Aliihoeflea sp.]
MRFLNSFGPVIAAGVLTSTSGVAQEAPHQPEETTALVENQSVIADDFMVASAHPLATQAGYDVLAAGGSAADAAIAVQTMLGLVEPQSSGLGGGAFLLYWDAEAAKLSTYDAREKAPLAADENYWLNETGAPLAFMDAVVGGRSAGVPGTPMLLERLHRDHGTMEWADLIQPAIDTAETGFTVTPRLAAAVASADGLDTFIATADYFLPGGKPITEGSTLTNRPYANSLRLLAQDGAAPFY